MDAFALAARKTMTKNTVGVDKLVKEAKERKEEEKRPPGNEEKEEEEEEEEGDNKGVVEMSRGDRRIKDAWMK